MRLPNSRSLGPALLAEAQQRAKHGRRHHVCTWRSRLVRVRARGFDVGGSGGAKDRLTASAQPPLSLPRSLVQGSGVFCGRGCERGAAAQRRGLSEDALAPTAPLDRRPSARGRGQWFVEKALLVLRCAAPSPRCRRETIRRRWRTRWRRGMRGRGASRRRGCRTRRARCHTGTTSPRRRTSRCAPCPLAQPRGLLSAISGWR